MNWVNFRDPVSHLCFAGTLVACWFFTQEVAGSSPFIVMINTFVTEFSEISETFRKNFIFILVQFYESDTVQDFINKYKNYMTFTHLFFAK